MGELMKNEFFLCSLFIVLMSLCDSDTKNQAENTNKFPGLEKKMESIRLLNLIKKLVFTCGTNDHKTRLSKAKVHINLMNSHQDRFQSVQEFRDQYLAQKKYAMY